MLSNLFKSIIFSFLLISNISFKAISQELDADELLERLERIEKNISDLQKGKVEELEKSLSSGYISRNESKLGDFETKIRTNFGLMEETNNKIQNLEEKVNLIDKEFLNKIKEIEQKLNKSKETKLKSESSPKKTFIENIPKLETPVSPSNKSTNISKDKNEIKSKVYNEDEIKKKYENAIKLLWANQYEKAEDELIQLKEIQPKDLMPNIQYWLGEVYYAQKNFQQAVVEFGEGFSNYPDSIKGPDNLLKLGLSFSNLNKKNEACSAFYELEVKYKNSPKNVIERSQEERKKLNCPKE